MERSNLAVINPFRVVLSTSLTLLLFFCISNASAKDGIANIMGDAFEVLEPDQAFSLELEANAGAEITARFSIEPGHYLYRDKMGLVSADASLQLLQVVSPTGTMQNDAYFGDTEIYREQVEIKAAYQLTGLDGPEQPRTADIKVLYQGCADIGICYPPQEKIVTVNLPDPASTVMAQADSGGTSVSSQLDALIGAGDDEELLPPEIAFVPSIGKQVSDKLSFRFSIEDGYYLYKDKISAELLDAGGAKIANLQLPPGKQKDDAFFGLVDVYRNSVDATLTLAGVEQTSDAKISIGYQGCADIGVCFPPQTTVLPVALAAISTTQPLTASNNSDTSSGNAIIAQTTPVNSSQSAPQSEQDRLAGTLSTQSIWLVILMFFGLGLLLAFTPCVFPMVPILSSIIVGQGDSLTTRKAFTLSLTYVLAMALTYTIAGVIVGLSGENIQIWFQTPWVLSLFAFVFVLLSLSMFGFYELQMPQSVQLKLNALSNNAEGGTYIGAGIMGFLSALIVGPCVTAPLVGALIFIADTGNAVVGGTALFALSMGMGTPLLLIGASCGKLLPKSGPWMDTTKAVFGVMLLALAIWMLSRFAPATVTLALSSALLVISGIFMGATDTLTSPASGWRRLSKGAGIVVLVYGLALLVGALSGGNSLLQPLNGIVASNSASSSDSTSTTQAGELQFQRVSSLAELEQQIQSAKNQGQTVMLDFYADWCVSCKEMEAFTFSDAGVQQRLSDTVLLKADVTANNDDDKALLKQFGLFGPPGIIFYSRDGDEIPSARLVGFMSADKFSAHLDKHL